MRTSNPHGVAFGVVIALGACSSSSPVPRPRAEPAVASSTVEQASAEPPAAPSPVVSAPASPSPDVAAEAPDVAAEAPDVAAEAPDVVLDGTDMVPLASLSVRAIDPSWAGRYGAEQGGSTVSLRLRVVGARWSVDRRHREPGERENRLVASVELRDGALRSADGSLVIRGLDAGVIVLERTPDGPISANYWVQYRRD